MRNTGLRVLLFLCAIISLSVVVSGKTHALTSRDLALTDDPFYKQAQLELAKKQAASEAKEASEKKQREQVKIKEAAAPAPVVHTVAAGESLSKIASQYGTTWQRLFNKNTQLPDPNILTINTVITVPAADEQLAERPVPVAAPAPVQVTTGRRSTAAPRARTTVVRGSSAGNTYAPGYCTWYAKSRRPDLPNRMGNAISWVASAAAQGFATGTVPRAGAIGQQGNHVVYIESVNGDGTVNLSEMNYHGLGVISTRTAPASSFRYIY